MQLNDGKILTSHGGNLPRPAEFDKLLAQGEARRAEITAGLPGAVEYVVEKQIECGVDVINDGEYVKAAGGGSYAGYIFDRVSGFESQPVDASRPGKRGGTAERDRLLFPGFYESGLWMQGSGGPVRPGFFTPGVLPKRTSEMVCTGPIAYTGQAAIAADIEALKAGLANRSQQGFIAALGPLSLAAGKRNEHYPDEQSYLVAAAEAVREEYKAITDAGLTVQIDEPEFFTTYSFYPEWSVDDLRAYLANAVEIINHALEGIPEDQVRFHSCWGSGHRPHVTDIELKHIVDLYLQVNAGVYSFEAGNVRHMHEWKVWRDVKLPEGKKIQPGVISHATDLVEHPEAVAERLLNYASAVGRENVEAGTDCGIGSRVGHEEIVWAKLRSMSEGAAIASKELWS
jgi:5-methyltetrahydropteroyltriglutamate--homocysteine methyltransferase